MSEQNKIFVSNFPFSSTENDLKGAFEKFGAIVEIAIPTDRDTRRPRGFAFITFESNQSAQDSLSMDGQDLGGRPLRVNIAKSKPKGEGRGNYHDEGRGGRGGRR